MLSLIVPNLTNERLVDYLADLKKNIVLLGSRLKKLLAGVDLEKLNADDFLAALLDTKKPQIFAESAVAGDGTDWNLTELSLLGDVSIAVPVTVFDNGNHQAPVAHEVPFVGTLVFTPGALLRNGRGMTPADWNEVTTPDAKLDEEGYYGLYERRLLPVFQYVNENTAAKGRLAFVTIPGLGCGCFAGPFAGKLGAALQVVLKQFLETHGQDFPSIKAVYFDPFNECSNSRREIHGVSLMVRPLMNGNRHKSQLCPPIFYEEEGDDFSDCDLFSIVAWDHVSWPGNDFFGGSRCTDDGVKAAATDVMFALTGVQGSYHAARGAYLPPNPYRTWGEVVDAKKLKLSER